MYRYKNLFNLNLIPLILHSKWNLIQVFYLILHLEKLSHSLVFNNSQNKKKITKIHYTEPYTVSPFRSRSFSLV